MAEWEKHKDGQFIRGGWWCEGRLHHHLKRERAEACEQKRAGEGGAGG